MRLNLEQSVRKYNTPKEIVATLERYTPQKINSILDPAVGEGALLYPFTKLPNGCLKEIICIDKDASVLKKVCQRFGAIFGSSLKVFHYDFMKWSDPGGQGREFAFDCIVMNPPFYARKNQLIRLELNKEFPELSLGSRYAPLEVAFVLRAFRLLKPAGTLMAIVPSSIVSSVKMKWFRKLMIQIGSVSHVHEFPHFTFKGVEGRTYVMIFKKSTKHNILELSNHNQEKPLRLKIKKFEAGDIRFDYSYHAALRWYEKLIRCSPNLNWTKIGDLAQILRGNTSSPFIGKKALHTSDFKNGFWQIKKQRSEYLRDSSTKGLRNGDLIVKRVGRNCSNSFGKAVSLDGFACSDCLLIIRPKRKKLSTLILFAIRLLVLSNNGCEILERGTGARYLTMDSLFDLMIPIGIGGEKPEICRQYSYAVAKMKISLMKDIEREIQKKIKIGAF